MLLAATSIFSQQETLISGDIENGAFGGPVLKISKIGDNEAIFMGGHGGWIINHKIVLGGGGFGLVNDIIMNEYSSAEELYLNFGYGGFYIEYILNSHKLVHLNFHTLVGAGGVGLRDKQFEDVSNTNSDALFVVEPGVNVILNFHKNVRVGIGGTYRFVNGIDMIGLSDSDLSNFNLQFVFKFGVF